MEVELMPIADVDAAAKRSITAAIRLVRTRPFIKRLLIEDVHSQIKSPFRFQRWASTPSCGPTPFSGKCALIRYCLLLLGVL